MSIWFNARVLVLEEAPLLLTELRKARARVSWAPLTPQHEQVNRCRILTGDWADPDFPYRLVEGHEVVLLRWPEGPEVHSEQVRWWLTAAMHLAESARRSRLRVFGFCGGKKAPPLLSSAAEFLRNYLPALEMSLVCADDADQLVSELAIH